MKTTISKEFLREAATCVAAFLVFLMISPYFMWRSSYAKVVPIALVVISLFMNLHITKKQLLLWASFALLYTMFLFRSGRNIAGWAVFELFLLLLLCSPYYLENLWGKFTKVYSLMLIPSIIVYFLVMMGVSLPHAPILPLNELKVDTMTQYPFLVVYDLSLNLQMFRFCSYFDEPGVVGTISGALLLIYGVKFKHWQTWPIIVSGIISLSLAFFIMFFLSIVFGGPERERERERDGRLLSIILLGTLVGVALYLLRDNEIVSTKILGRLMITDDGLAGDNRTSDSFDQFYKYYIKSNKVFWGYGGGHANLYDLGGASYKHIIVDYGIVGFAALLMVAFCNAAMNIGTKRERIVYMIMFLCIMFQRPFILAHFYCCLLYLPMFCFSKRI